MMAASAGFAADSVLPDCIPPETDVLIGASVRNLMDSAVLKTFQSEMQNTFAEMVKNAQLPALEMMKTGSTSVLDALKNIDNVIIASTLRQDKSTALVVLRGKFDPQRWPGTPATYKGITIFGDPKKADNSVVAFLDESTAVAGDLADVHAAIDRRGRPARIRPSLAARVQWLAERFDFWAVGELPEGVQPPPGTADDLKSIDRFQFGASMRQGLEIDGEVHARTAQDAAKMAQTMQMISAMLKSQPTSSSGTKFDLQSANGTIKLAIVIPEEDLKKGIQARMAPNAADPAAAPKPVAKRPAAPATIVKDAHGDTVTVKLPGSR